jgi:hypothetical protein
LTHQVVVNAGQRSSRFVVGAGLVRALSDVPAAVVAPGGAGVAAAIVRRQAAGVVNRASNAVASGVSRLMRVVAVAERSVQ